MAGSVNKVILIGHLGRDPEVRHSQDGSKIVTLSVATSESWKDRFSGERREKTEWHRVVIFNPNLADIAERYLRKGAKAYLEGALQTRKWADQLGNEHYITEIVVGRFRGELALLDSRSGGGPSLSYDDTLEEKKYDPSSMSSMTASGERMSPEKDYASGEIATKSGVLWDRSAPDLDDEIPF